MLEPCGPSKAPQFSHFRRKEKGDPRKASPHWRAAEWSQTQALPAALQPQALSGVSPGPQLPRSPFAPGSHLHQAESAKHRVRAPKRQSFLKQCLQQLRWKKKGAGSVQWGLRNELTKGLTKKCLSTFPEGDACALCCAWCWENSVQDRSRARPHCLQAPKQVSRRF